MGANVEADMRADIGVIGGTAASLTLDDPTQISLDTPFGPLVATVGRAASSSVAFVRRHGDRHQLISSAMNHRAVIWGLRELGVQAILATTVVGVLDPGLALGIPIVFDDLFFIDNRLPDGSACTFFTEPDTAERGHLIFDKPFSEGLRRQVAAAAQNARVDILDSGTYAYALGPRFNSKPEIAWLRSVGACAVSQTAGPEPILAGELEIPYCLIGFGVDYANGVGAVPTPVETLNRNIALGTHVLENLLLGTIERFETTGFDIGLVYRLEEHQ